MKLLQLAVSLLICDFTKAHRAIECFEESLLLGGTNVNTREMTDLDMLLNLDQDHVVTSVKVCTDRAVTIVKGAQVSYGKFNGAGEIESAVSMNPLGDVEHATSVCTIFYIPEGEWISTITYRYEAAGITQLWMTTNGGSSGSYGRVAGDFNT